MSGQTGAADVQRPTFFHVRDIRQSLEHYRALGFAVTWQSAEGTGGIVERGDLVIHLNQGEGEERTDRVTERPLQVDDALAVAFEWSLPDVGGTTTFPVRTVHGQREAVHSDLDGNVIRFASNIFDRATQVSIREL